MAVDDQPIAAVRVESAAVPPVAASGPAVAIEQPPAAPVAAAALGSEPAPVVAEVVPAKVEPAIELSSERPSLLETVGKKPAGPAEAAAAKVEAAKPEAKIEAAKVEPAKESAKPEAAKEPVKLEDGKSPEAKAAEPEKAPLAAIDYKYELPATLKMDDALKGDLHTALDAFRADPTAGVQPLINLHNKVITDLRTADAAETLRNQHRAFNDTRTQWNKDWAADDQIGGAGYQTALKAVARMRDQFVSAELPGTPKYESDRKSFEEFLRVTGAGDHPAFGRFLHNIAQAFDEPALPPQNGKPAPSNGQKPGSRRERMYDHPSSSKTS